jgi:DNA replication protein DnaC
MSNKYVLEVLKEYEQQHERSQSMQKQRQAEIYTKLPKIKKIDEDISSLGFDIASSIFKGINVESYLSDQKRKITDLKILKAEILTENSYPIDYLEIKYKCNKCKDTGYIGSEKCVCFKQRLINKYYQQSNLSDILSRENFDTFNIGFYSTEKCGNEILSPRKNMEEILTRCIGYSNNFKASRENLFFYGNSGLGKTFLSNCIAKDLLDKGCVVIYQTSSALIELLRNSRFDEDSQKDIIKDILECDLLIIDDLGTEPATPYSQSELFNIINSRILSDKKMIISTNFLVDDLFKTYPERITSRIFGNFTMFKFYGDDIRIKNNINKRKNTK